MGAEQRLQAAIQKVSETMTANAATQTKETERVQTQGKEYTDKSTQNLHQQLIPQFTALQKNLDSLDKKMEEKFKEHKEKASAELAKTIEELCSNMSEELNTLSADIVGKIDEAKKEMYKADE